MTLAAVIFDCLSNDAGIASVVTADSGEVCIYPMRRREKAHVPSISWRRIDTGRDYTYESYEDTAAWVSARVEFNCWAYTFDEADALGDGLIFALSGYFGPGIGAAFVIDEADHYEEDTKFFRKRVDVRISYEDDLVAVS